MKEFMENLISGTSNDSLLLILALGIIFFVLILTLILIISYVKAIKKANLSGANIIWFFLPIIGIIILAFKLDPVKKFNKGSGYLVGLILLPIIFVPLLAFSDKSETVKQESSVNASFDAKTFITQGENVSLNNVQDIPLASNIDIVKEKSENIENVETGSTSEEIASENSIDLAEEINNDVQLQENNIVQDIPLASNIEVQNEEPIMDDSSYLINDTNAFQGISEELPNDFNTTTEVDNKMQDSTINAFNSEPDLTFNLNNDSQEGLSNTNEISNNNETVNLGETKKVCVNCGNELPSIVSICPNCGTDNE